MVYLLLISFKLALIVFGKNFVLIINSSRA